ncbi:MAG: SGNH/GDSL hydrolase family protein [Chitinophagaceae bacterium]|nr:SGNH/GDSL hydrolase family protein [Chitinophagaceae bacterium]MCW5929252.1 SGNH/GDSL hydrolase family protein [Chitinophagaceae bacterium]
MYRIIAAVGLMILTVPQLSLAQNDHPAWEAYVNMNDFLQPFWKADTIYSEAVQPIKEGDKNPEAQLLFKAKKILSVRDTYLQKTYKKNKDWKYKNGKLVLTRRTTIPYFTTEELLFSGKKEGTSLQAKKDGYYVLFSESGLLQSRQLAVTYVKEKESNWKGPLPAYAEKLLPATLDKLKSGRPLKVVFYGNSIETGANSSVTLNQPPFLPTWPEMIMYNLRRYYTQSIAFKNVSKGGMAARWGLDNAPSLVSSENPDLVIIGFGMNDGTGKVAPEIFIEQIKGIIGTVRQANPSCEFIVIATMLANPEAVHSQIQQEYLKPVLGLASEGVAVADMTSIHGELLRHKAYQDMTGNNINHPNDYLARWYAQVISALLIR